MLVPRLVPCLISGHYRYYHLVWPKRLLGQCCIQRKKRFRTPVPILDAECWAMFTQRIFPMEIGGRNLRDTLGFLCAFLCLFFYFFSWSDFIISAGKNTHKSSQCELRCVNIPCGFKLSFPHSCRVFLTRLKSPLMACRKLTGLLS